MYEKRHERHDRLPATGHLESDAEVTEYLILAIGERLTADNAATKEKLWLAANARLEPHF